MTTKTKGLSKRWISWLDAAWLTRLGNLATLYWVIPLLIGVGNWIWLRGFDVVTVIAIAIGFTGLGLQVLGLLRKPEQGMADGEPLLGERDQIDPKAPPHSGAISKSKGPIASARTEKPASGSRERLGDLLQRQLNRGRELQRDMPAIAGMASLNEHVTTAEDVDVWIRHTRRKLKPTPELLADFEYQRNKGPLAAFLQPQNFAPEYKSRLDLRVANLTEIVADLRRQAR